MDATQVLFDQIKRYMPMTHITFLVMIPRRGCTRNRGIYVFKLSTVRAPNAFDFDTQVNVTFDCDKKLIHVFAYVETQYTKF